MLALCLRVQYVPLIAHYPAQRAGKENVMPAFGDNKNVYCYLDDLYVYLLSARARRWCGASRCDIIMGYPQGDELVQNTNAYYRSVYVLVHPKGTDMEGVETIEDPRLAGKRIGVVEATPPTANMAANKLLRTAKIYPLAVDTRVTLSWGRS